jgi:hypothetical protein
MFIFILFLCVCVLFRVFILRNRTGGRFLRVVFCRRDSKPRRGCKPSRRGGSATPDLTGGNALKCFLDDEVVMAGFVFMPHAATPGNSPSGAFPHRSI